MLFGDKIEYCKNVRKNDLLVLYNTETDTLYGPFIAISDKGKILIRMHGGAGFHIK